MLFNAIAIMIGGLAIFDLCFFGWLFWRIRRDERAAKTNPNSGCGCPLHRGN
jgi:uncharacterized iron-regulated membrane protein